MGFGRAACVQAAYGVGVVRVSARCEEASVEIGEV